MDTNTQWGAAEHSLLKPFLMDLIEVFEKIEAIWGWWCLLVSVHAKRQYRFLKVEDVHTIIVWVSMLCLCTCLYSQSMWALHSCMCVVPDRILALCDLYSGSSSVTPVTDLTIHSNIAVGQHISLTHDDVSWWSWGERQSTQWRMIPLIIMRDINTWQM